jgi:hypothetical protein
MTKQKLLFPCMVLLALSSLGFAHAIGEKDDKDDKTWHAGTPVRAAFADGGKVMLKLGAGDATIIAKPGAKEIVITYDVRDESKLKNVRADVQVSGNFAQISVHGPKNFRYRIEMPAREDVTLRMTAGDLSLTGVDGNLDSELHAGDCDIKLGTAAENYGPVDFSVGAGDINADAFGAQKGGLLRKFRLQRSGKYRLHVHVGAGDLRVNQS